MGSNPVGIVSREQTGEYSSSPVATCVFLLREERCTVEEVAEKFVQVVYPFFLSPVRHIPGPWYARVSKLPLQYASFSRRRTEYATQLLAKYGPTVVIAPDQVHTTDDTAMKSIYDKTAVKTSFYSSMGSWKGVKSTLGFLTYPEAVPSRTNLVQCFQNRNLAVLVENMASHIDDFVRLLDQKVENDEPVDGVVAFRLLALDIVTDVLWGEQHRLLGEVDEEAARTFIRRFHAFSTWNALKGFIPVADFYVRNFGNRKWRTLRSDCDDLDITAKQALERWNQGEDSGQRHDKDVLSMLQSMNSKSSAVPASDLPAYREYSRQPLLGQPEAPTHVPCTNAKQSLKCLLPAVAQLHILLRLLASC